MGVVGGCKTRTMQTMQVGHKVMQKLTLAMDMETFTKWRKELEYGYGMTVGVVTPNCDYLNGCKIDVNAEAVQVRVNAEVAQHVAVAFTTHVSQSSPTVTYEEVNRACELFQPARLFENANRAVEVLKFKNKEILGWSKVKQHLQFKAHHLISVEQPMVEAIGQEREIIKGHRQWNQVASQMDVAGRVAVAARNAYGLHIFQPTVIEQSLMGTLRPEDSPFPYPPVYYNKIAYDERHCPQLWQRRVAESGACTRFPKWARRHGPHFDYEEY